MSQSGPPEYRYVGDELELFARATNWKAYVRQQLEPYVGGDVLEVGAGMGTTTHALFNRRCRRWVCVEPDAALAAKLQASLARGPLEGRCEVVTGTLVAVPPRPAFDSVLYVDVLEHILDDRGEIEMAVRLLIAGGHLIVLAPAHQHLYSPFDGAIGHFRRYDRATLTALTPAGLHLERLRYLDTAGWLASAGNRLLRRSMPSRRQLALWDAGLVRASRVLDPLFRYRFGKSILAVWRRE